MQKIIILGHENPDLDSIVSGYLLEKIMKKMGYEAEYIIPDDVVENDTYRLCLKHGLDIKQFMKKIDFNNPDNKYILVDHNERLLAGKIVYIIDHHPSSKNTKDMLNKRSSSTACIICQGREDLLDEKDLKLAVVATLVDTISFNSTKSREVDKEWVQTICNKYKFNYEDLKKDGLCLTSLAELNKAVFNNHKTHYLDNLTLESSIIQIDKMDGDLLCNIVDIIKKHMEKEKLDVYLFITHNMNKCNTTYYLIKKDEIRIKHYHEFTSRGNTIIPEIEKKLLLKK